MQTDEAFCVRCGSADTRVTHLDQSSADGDCLRCDQPFHATPCQNCGGFRIDGSFGVPGARFENLPKSVKCWDCGYRNPLRDPGPE
ncbi:hypothetical protein [Streptomyces lydicus]|uniref:hypothetical protein n=1 Tax=Streptomyces lydicus TaxID=47763 RepID=UPI0037A6072F